MKRRPQTLDDLRAGGKAGLARALSAVETEDGTAELATFLDEAALDPKGTVIGLTGPPGVGKSTLTNALIAAFRGRGETVGVIAVDPSSQLTGGALLGDRTRLRTDPEDTGVFVRSMAARDRLGGLSDHAVAGIALMRAVMDRVIVESVGIGQSEADVAFAVDTVVLCIQPGSGDSLQFMKAGIMELPDVVAVTKADMGAPARRARADVEGALSLARLSHDRPSPRVVMVSASDGTGVDDLVAACDAHSAVSLSAGKLDLRRREQHLKWVEDAVRDRFGRRGLSVCDVASALAESAGPFAAILYLERTLEERMKGS
ncbi:methylmalonyl Co-A mutase-associated GTPase MeaB [Stappia sp. GBMRC 2046]|uniref:Methylmalonyl Co-A mutase-associated GTPase MeaB n=1 Tax=Stappia sediminis TaxID=2692190 RepID=A0A7X3LRK8_9HYPH|nr:methylmalonyl Co-A mutase-associated GTPase MeaB [Stappia sediminis]MXN63804.1 methylmalonyl Co-A mutase-associated GTPase MeaB [Stappia sediminis]